MVARVPVPLAHILRQHDHLPTSLSDTFRSGPQRLMPTRGIKYASTEAGKPGRRPGDP